jgi:hypothetical protein
MLVLLSVVPPLFLGCKTWPAKVFDHIKLHRGMPALFWDQLQLARTLRFVPRTEDGKGTLGRGSGFRLPLHSHLEDFARPRIF